MDNRNTDINKKLDFLKRNLYIIIALFVLIIFFFVVFSDSLLDKIQETNYEYIELALEDDLHGFVKSNYCDRGIAYIELTNNTKVWIRTSVNYSYSPKLLCHFIKPGDRIVKNSNTDSLVIFRKKQKYYFLIGQEIE